MHSRHCSPAFSLLFRLRIPNRSGMFSSIASAIAKAGGDLGEVNIISESRVDLVRDVEVRCANEKHQHEVIAALKSLDEIEVLQVEDRTFAWHLSGKIAIHSRRPLKNAAELAMAYTPGVARVCKAIEEDPTRSYRLTLRRNTVAVVTDGSAVLGLGNIGPLGAMPVMEGKALLFKEFGGVDAFPICLDTQDAEEIITIVKSLAPTFGGINLEDISAPRCFEIEKRLRDELDIPVFHDDQHGTAIVTLAGLLNALRIVGKKISEIKVVFCGVGAAGMACTKLLMAAGVKNVIGVDSVGAIYEGRTERMNESKEWYARNTNPDRLQGKVSDVIKGADVFVGVSGPGTLTADDVKLMAAKPIVFAMSNPEPEIDPEEAAPYVAVMATGRSDFPNQINNVLAFPGLFRGLLDTQSSTITESMCLAAAHAIANTVSEEKLGSEWIIPSVFDKNVSSNVAEAVKAAALREGVSQGTGEYIPIVDQLRI